MFKGLTKDLTGTADICNTVTNFSKIHGAQYVLPGEEVLFAFASAKEEFVFTNEALITVCGENAMTTRKPVLRYEYRDNPLSQVQFETTGRVDRDCEIKFKIGEYPIFIDIAKKEEELVKSHYKALVALSREQKQRLQSWENAKEGLDKTSDALHLKGANHGDDELSLTAQSSSTLAWLENDYERIQPRIFKTTIAAALPTARRK
ncbi:P-loop containing nucleoside triphosphate hydrolase, partial [Globisporangium splendens]